MIASPHSVLTADPDAPASVPSALLELIEQLRPSEIVVGIPLHMDGREGEMAGEARGFARGLAAATGLPVVEWDERLSSRSAERTLLDIGAPRSRRREKGRLDMVAAATLLRGYLRSRGGGEA